MVDPRAPDVEIVAWARAQAAVILTADIDFSTILALQAHAVALQRGAIVTVDLAAARVRVLPVRSAQDRPE